MKMKLRQPLASEFLSILVGCDKTSHDNADSLRSTFLGHIYTAKIKGLCE